MKIIAVIALLSTLGTSLARSEAVIPNLLEFDAPSDLDRFKPSSGGPGANPFSFVQPFAEYLARDNSYKSHRQINVNIRGVGVSVGQGKVISYSTVDSEELLDIFSETYKLERLTITSGPFDTNFGGRDGISITYEVDLPQKEIGEKIYAQVIWIKIEPNKVLEVSFTANSTQNLENLIESSLSKFSINIEEANKAVDTTPVSAPR